LFKFEEAFLGRLDSTTSYQSFSNGTFLRIPAPSGSPIDDSESAEE
jgi:hypothetical protein